MTRLSRHFTVDTFHKDRPFTVYHLAVHTYGYGRQFPRRQSLYIGLDISIYSVYIIESELAEFCPITHSPPSSSELLLSSQFHITCKMVSVIAIISLGSLT